MTKRDDTSAIWDLGDLLTPDDQLTRGVPIDLRLLPLVEDVKIRDGYLVFTLAEPDRIIDGSGIWDPTSDRMQAALLNIRDRDRTDMLREFVKLHALPDEGILEYAKMWGRLRLCHHNVPYQHSALEGAAKALMKKPPPDPVLSQLTQERRYPWTSSRCAPLLWEPLETWRFFSGQADAILKIAARVHNRLPGLDSDWDCVFPHELAYQWPNAEKSRLVRSHEGFLLAALREWMRMGSFHPSLRNLSGKVSLGGADLFSKLSLELALAVSRTKARVSVRSAAVNTKPSARRQRGARIFAAILHAEKKGQDCVRRSPDGRSQRKSRSA